MILGHAARQYEATTGDAWLPIDEAATLTGDSLRTLRWRAKSEANDARRQGRQSLAHKATSRDGKGKPT